MGDSHEIGIRGRSEERHMGLDRAVGWAQTHWLEMSIQSQERL